MMMTSDSEVIMRMRHVLNVADDTRPSAGARKRVLGGGSFSFGADPAPPLPHPSLRFHRSLPLPSPLEVGP